MKLLIDRAVVEQALHVAMAAEHPVALIAALRAALAEEPEGGGNLPPPLLAAEPQEDDPWGAGLEAGYAAGLAEAEPVQEPAKDHFPDVTKMVQEQVAPELPWKPWKPVELGRGCQVCGIGADGKASGFVCTRGDCPTRFTCGVR